MERAYRDALDSIRANPMVDIFLNGRQPGSVRIAVADTMICPQLLDFRTQIAKRRYLNYADIRRLRDTIAIEARMLDSVCTTGGSVVITTTLLSEPDANGLVYLSAIRRSDYFQNSILTATVLRDSILRGGFEEQSFSAPYLEFLYVVNREGRILDTYVVRSEP